MLEEKKKKEWEKRKTVQEYRDVSSISYFSIVVVILVVLLGIECIISSLSYH